MPLTGVTSVLSHAFGQRYESPVPLAFFVLGGAVVVLASFALVARRSVSGAGGGVPDESAQLPPGSTGTTGWPGLLGLAVLIFLIIAGLAGNQDLEANILPTSFWVYLWVILPMVTSLLGNLAAPLNPFAALAQLAGSPRIRRMLLGTEHPALWPQRAGWWPAVMLFFVVIEAELVFNRVAVRPSVTAMGLLVYALICAVGGLIFGAATWNSRAELFSVMLDAWGRLGFWRWGQPGVTGFGGGLDRSFLSVPSRVTFVVMMLAGVTFDGVLSTPQWARLLSALPAEPAPGSAGAAAFTTVCFLLTVAAMYALFGTFARRSAIAGGYPGSVTAALAGLAPSLVPISYGYLLAHYSQYVLVNGQLLIPALGNPLGLAATSYLPYPFDASYVTNTSIMPTRVLWYVQIVVIIAAHIMAVVIAHRFLCRRAATPARALAAEWPWLVAMVLYTMISLWLLAQPLVAEAAS